MAKIHGKYSLVTWRKSKLQTLQNWARACLNTSRWNMFRHSMQLNYTIWYNAYFSIRLVGGIVQTEEWKFPFFFFLTTSLNFKYFSSGNFKIVCSPDLHFSMWDKSSWLWDSLNMCLDCLFFESKFIFFRQYGQDIVFEKLALFLPM